MRKLIGIAMCAMLIGGDSIAQLKGDESVQVELRGRTHVRKLRDDLLIPEASLPPGTIVEVPVSAYQKAEDMPFSDEGKLNARQSFVKGVKIIKVPGLSDQEVKELNAWRADQGLFIAKDPLGDAKIVQVKGRNQITTSQSSSVYRNDGVAPPDKRPKAEPEEGVKPESVVENVHDVNRVAGAASSDVKCSDARKRYYDKFVKAGVPAKALKEALEMQERNPRGMIHNKRYLTITDFTQPSNKRRMFILDTETGQVEKLFTSHSNRTETKLGHAGHFGNSSSSNLTPAGFHVTGYRDRSGRVQIAPGFHDSPTKGTSLLLIGLESRNSNSAARQILIHKGWYATDAFVNKYGYTGRSHGCLAIDPAKLQDVLHKLQNGSLVYNYTG